MEALNMWSRTKFLKTLDGLLNYLKAVTGMKQNHLSETAPVFRCGTDYSTRSARLNSGTMPYNMPPLPKRCDGVHTPSRSIFGYF